MKIGIDGYEANIINRVGSGQFAYQLLKQLSKVEDNHDYLIFLPSTELPDMPLQSNRWKYVIGDKGALWTLRSLPNLIKKNPVDLFFSPTHYAPLFVSVPRIISIMDLSYFHYPAMFRFKDLLQLKLMTQLSVHKASAICTISDFSKREIVEHYHYKADNIHVTYPGVQSFSQGVEISSKSQSLQAKHYILFVGTIQPRKNLIRLIEAFEMLKIDCNLVVAGKKGWLYEPIFAKIANSVKKDAIKYIDFVTTDELSRLYNNASCFVLPSLYEGFGITVIEAMSAGCPVVVSNTASLPEVAGSAGIYVDPMDKDSIAQGLIKALQLSDNGRFVLQRKGKVQAEKFTWESCAQKVISVFNRFS